MSPITALFAALLAPPAIVLSVPIDKHINLFYAGLAIIFACVLAYMFFSKKPQ